MTAAARVILLTGCSSPHGIGHAAARQLARRGHCVHATVRDHSADDGLRKGLEDRLTIHHLDLLDQATITSAVAEVLAASGGIDVLINNAGYGLIGGVEQVGMDQARAVFETDVFGTLALTQEVLPIMRRQRSGHVIVVSSVFVAGLCPPALGCYVGAKAAVESAAQALAIEAAPWNISVTSFQPGPVMTELERQWGDRLSADADPRPSLSDELYQWVLEGHGPQPQSADEVAEALCALVESEAPPLASQSGRAAHDYVAAALADPSRMTELAPLLEAFGAGPAAEQAAGVVLHPLAQRFASVADEYERGRPDYRPAVVGALAAELALSAGATVLDLGAGTGKLSRTLLECGFDVVAVEPLDSLRAVLVQRIGPDRVREGVAERIPLPDGSVAAVTAADAFHWFDRQAAVDEIGRVLAPGGGLAVLSMVPDWSGASWAHELGTLVANIRPEHPHFDGPPWQESIRGVAGWSEPWEVRVTTDQPTTPERVVDHLSSMSWIAALPDEERAAALARIRELVTSGETRSVMPVHAVIGLATLRADH